MRSCTSRWAAFGLVAAAAIVSSALHIDGTPRLQLPVAVARADESDLSFAADTRTYLQRLERLGFAGCVLVARGDTPLFAEGFGLADRERGLRWGPHTVSDIGSITKQFTAAAILTLEEEGRLRVTDSLSKYFDGVPADKSTITLHQLLAHSSGLSDPEDLDDFDPITREEYVRKVLARSLTFAPGSGYAYANANFSLLGAIIEKLSGQSYEAFLRARLFLPSGMFETGYLLPQWGEGRVAVGYEAGTRWGTFLERPMAPDGPYWALRANGGIHTTAYDMLRWARALLEGRILTAASMDKLWAPHVSQGGDSHYAYGWSIVPGPGGKKLVTHDGGNGIYFANLGIVPEADLVVFLMTNVIAENRSANSLLQQIVARQLGGEPYPVIPEIVDVATPPSGDFAGTYRLPNGAGAYHLAVEDRTLYIDAAGQRAFDRLHSVRESDPRRLEKLSERMDRILAGNLRGDFSALSRAYGGRIPLERLKARWAELTRTFESAHGRLLRYEVLGTASTQDRDETVVRFHGERGFVDRTYVWDRTKEERLLGVSARGLAVHLALFRSGAYEYFTWDGGIRPPKRVRLQTGSDGKLRLAIGDSPASAVR